MKILDAARDQLKTIAGRILKAIITPDMFSGAYASAMADAGIPVSEQGAMRLAAVYACVRVLSESLASLPCILYRREGDKKKRATDHPTYYVMHDEANPISSSFIARETLQAITTLWGNGYGKLSKDKKGRTIAVDPMPAGLSYPLEVKAGELFYRVTDHDGTQDTIAGKELLHIPGLGFDGKSGLSVIGYARNTIGLALGSDKMAARYYAQGSRPGGVIEMQKGLSDKAFKRFKANWKSAYEGPENVGKTAILEDGMSWKAVSVPPSDAQFLESRRFSVNEIARIFRVPPHMIGDLERATFSNIEQQSLEFVIYTLRPWLVRWEQELNRKLISPSERKMFYFEFLVDGLLRGDIATRYKAYAIGRNWGWLSANDVRKMENLDPIKDGDVYLTPVNMQTSPGDGITPDDKSSDETKEPRLVAVGAERWKQISKSS